VGRDTTKQGKYYAGGGTIEAGSVTTRLIGGEFVAGGGKNREKVS
jgi:hypothetical protein